MQREELAAWLRLELTPGIGPQTARRLLATFGLPQAVFEQPVQALEQLLSPVQTRALAQESAKLPEVLETTWQWLMQAPAERAVITLADARYPASLLAMEDPPLFVYLMGRLDLAADINCSVAIVGSRNPTPQGVLNARQFSRSLRQAGLTIVSGLALGIDGAAHEGALDELETAPLSPTLATIAVVGTGLDRVYPKSHHKLAHRIAQHGWLLSEYPLGTPPLAPNFPRRNRLIAGLSCATLVVEAALESGSLITARLATEQGKDVFAIPGSIHATQSRGCHALIRQGAKLVETAQDVLEELPGYSRPASVTASEAAGEASPGEGTLLEAMGVDPVSLDALQARTGLPIEQLQAQLMQLELDGQTARLPGGLIQRLIRS